jgi:hypothetical protein
LKIESNFITDILICWLAPIAIISGSGKSSTQPGSPDLIRKTFLAAAALLSLSTAGITPAKADIDITLNLGYGGGYHGRISCGIGALIVDRRFNQVVRRDCFGSHYQYTGRRNGK